MKTTLLSERYESVELRVRTLLFFVDVVGAILFFPSRIFTGEVKNLILKI